jgi:hypothetical protein
MNPPIITLSSVRTKPRVLMLDSSESPVEPVGPLTCGGKFGDEPGLLSATADTAMHPMRMKILKSARTN